MKLFWQIAVLGLFGTLAACGKEGSTDTEDTEDTEDTNVPETETDCDDGEDEDEDGDEDCEDADCASAEDCLWIPTFINASGAFAYDATADSLVDVNLAGTGQPPLIDIFIGNQNFQDTQDLDNDACDILLVYSGDTEVELDTWTSKVDGADADFVGFVLESGDYEVATNCSDFPFDESVIGSIDEIAAMGWGAAVGPLSSSDKDIILDQLTDDSVIGNYGGGGFYWGAASTTSLAVGGYSIGWAIDPDSYAVLNDEGEPAAEGDSVTFLAAEDFATGDGTLPTGYYQTGAFVAYPLTQ